MKGGQCDLVVVGGGPAGLFAAISAARTGARVTILEKMPSAGIKLRASGAGRCNISHQGPIGEFLSHYGEGQGRFLKPALYHFDNEALRSWLADRGLELVVDERGKYFPASGRAGDVLELLLRELAGLSVTLRTESRVLGITAREGAFALRTENADLDCRSLILATGGKSYPGTGSTGEGYGLAEALGHRVEPPLPCLTPLFVAGPLPASCMGISLRNAGLSVRRGGSRILERRGELLFTHRGISGPLVLDASRAVLSGDLVLINLLPDKDGETLDRELREELDRHGKRSIAASIQALGLPERLALAILSWAGVEPSQRASLLDRSRRKRVVEALGGLPLIVEGRGGFEEAMATRGGVCLKEVNPRSLESRLVPGLFFAGELLDIDGDTGGYNLQAAISTGSLAGASAAARLAQTADSPYYSARSS